MTQDRSQTSGITIGRVVVSCLVALVVAVCAYGFVLYTSYARLMELKDDIGVSAQALEDALENQDAQGFCDSLRALSEEVEQTDKELDSFVWHIACHFPVYGTDVDGAVTLVEIARNLMEEISDPLVALIGAMQEYTDLSAGDWGYGAEHLGAVLGDILDYAEHVKSQKTNLEDTRVLLATLPAYHTEDLNEAKQVLEDVIDELCEVIDELEPYLEVYEGLRAGADALSQEADALNQQLDELGRQVDELGQQVEGFFDDLADSAQTLLDQAGTWLEDSFGDPADWFTN